MRLGSEKEQRSAVSSKVLSFGYPIGLVIKKIIYLLLLIFFLLIITAAIIATMKMSTRLRNVFVKLMSFQRTEQLNDHTNAHSVNVSN